MPIITSRAALEREIQRRAVYALTQCTDIMTNVLHESIQANVYNAYTPKVYERRGDDGGLLDIMNYDAEVDPADLSITMRDNALGGFDGADYSDDLDATVTQGWHSNELNWGIRGRPFYPVAQDILDAQSGEVGAVILDAMKKGV